MFTCIKFTTRIKWCYEGIECPKQFKVKAGRSSGVYGTEIFTSNGHVREIQCEMLDYDGLGTYYVKVFAIDKDDNEIGGSEFTIDLVNPSEEVVAPSCIRIVNNE